MEFHVDDQFGPRRFEPADVPLLKALLAKKTSWTPDERQFMNMVVRDTERAHEILDRAWLLVQEEAHEQ